MDILNSFGLETRLFVAQIVNFLVLVVIIRLFLYKPVKAVLKERADRIKQGLDDSAQAKATLEATRREKDEMLKTARLEMQEIVNNAKQTAEGVKEQIIKDSKTESERIIAQAHAQAAAEMDRMEKQIKTMSLDLSQKVLLNILPSLFDPAEKDRVMKKALAELENNTRHEQGNA